MNEDKGVKYTEAQLKAVENKFKQIYKEAQKDVEKKLNDYLAKFREQDDKKREQLNNGKITEQQYKQWRKNKIMTGKRWKEMRDKLADDYTHANIRAINALNGALPQVFAENVNYTTYDIEQLTGLNTSFTLYNQDTVNRLVLDNPDILPKPSVDIPKDQLWNRQHIQSAILQGVLQGESMQKVAKRLQQVSAMNNTAAQRSARTAMTGAQNGGRVEGYKRAESLGIKMLQEWVATYDSRTRHSHAILDGERRKVGEKFSNGLLYPGDPNGRGEEIYNCFTGDTNIATDSEIIRSYKSEYKGDLIVIETARGVKFTCTPNHPILTPSGWVKAAILNNGDDLIVTIIGNKKFARRNPNIQHIFPSIEAIHNFGNKVFGKRVGALSVNFHGDIPASDVEVISQKGFLRYNRNARSSESVNKFLLKCSNTFNFCNSNFMKHFRRICKTAFSNIRRISKPFPFIKGSVCHSGIHGFRPIANRNVSVAQNAINNISTDTKIFRELFSGNAAKIARDKIISVKVISSRCTTTHVYNLQTENGYYFVNSIIPQNQLKVNGIFAIAKNCRCGLIAQLAGFESDVSARTAPLEKMGVTYEEWKEQHRAKMKKPS